MKTADRKDLWVVLCGLAVVAGLSSCATPHTTTSTGMTSYLAYDGKQQSWPRGSSTLAKTDFAVPAYLGLPSKPYQLVGYVVNAEPTIHGHGLPEWIWTDETRLANACNQAKAHGADAVVLTNDPKILQALAAANAAGSPNRRLLANSEGEIVAIKWK